MGQSTSCFACDNGGATSRGPIETATIGGAQNSAFVFVKPHANVQAVKDLVEKKLAENGIKVLRDGEIDAETIDKKGLIDTHYGAIASRALKQKPRDLIVQDKAKDEFKKLFGISWEAALKKGLVYNAADGAPKLGIKPLALSERFDKLKRGEKQVKFGGGFYVGKVGSIYVVNGFYTGMRSKFTTPGANISYYEVAWDSEQLPWAKFRGEVIGGTNPKEAVEGSIRNTIFQEWKALGLKAEPDTGDNGVHASASAFEGLAEKANWLEAQPGDDSLGAALLVAGVSTDTLQAWFADRPVTLDGQERSLFDLLEDTDCLPTVEIARRLLETPENGVASAA